VTAKQRHSASLFLRNAARTAFLLPLVLLGCSGIALPKEDAPTSGPESAYYKLVADRLRDTFKDIDSYNAFEISAFRWVHTVKGWSWLTCVRFRDRDRRRTYTLLIKAEEIVDSRYAVETDGCDTLTYAPFDQMPNAAKPASGGELEPLH
jgi:hypothetical protein